MGVKLSFHNPPGREGYHGRQGTQGQTCGELDGPLQSSSTWSLLHCAHPGRFTARRKFYFDLPSDLPGPDARQRVAIERCKPCANSHVGDDKPKYLPAGSTQIVRSNFSIESPPYDVTQDDVSPPLQCLEVEKITSHQSVQGRGGFIAVLYKTHWVGLSEPSCER